MLNFPPIYLHLEQKRPKFGPGANHGTRSDFMRSAASILVCFIYGLVSTVKQYYNLQVQNAVSSFHLMVAAPIRNVACLRDPCCDPCQLISAMGTVDKKRKDDVEGSGLQERRNNCVCLICQETVAMNTEFNVKRHHQTKGANAYNKLSGSNWAEANEDTTKASYKVAMLIAKHSKPFTFY